MKTDVLIVGAGLSGLALARDLERIGVDYRVVEARDRVGGRIKSVRTAASRTPSASYDLGPAWIWPGQPRIARLAREFGVDIFEQHADGTLVFQDASGAIRRDVALATMAGALRLQGGVASLAEKMAAAMPHDRLRLSAPLRSLAGLADGLAATIDGESTPLLARRAVLAVPPRLAAARIAFAPALSPSERNALMAIPTWMAGHAKVVAIYDCPFWRKVGLSGDGISHRGPLAEIHDASPAQAREGALFGFVGLSAAARRRPDFDLTAACIRQLTAMFGAPAASPLDVLVEDWAIDPWTTTDADQEALTSHPAYGLPPHLARLWGGRLTFASTELATHSGGLLEGALEAAEAVLARLTAG